MKKIFVAATAATLIAGVAQAAPVDLTSWTAENSDFGTQPPANWDVAADKQTVFQTINSDPAVFYDSGDAQGKALSGTIEVKTTDDDDFIGFVLGFDAGEINGSASSVDYWLIDWKQGTQDYQGSEAKAGLALSHVTGFSDADAGNGFLEGQELWGHIGDVNEVARGNNLGSTGWSNNTQHVFELVFTQNLIQVSVDGNVELSWTSAQNGGTFENGGFGFYNYSQMSVEYAGIEEDPAPKIPLPAGLPLLVGALGVLGFARRKN